MASIRKNRGKWLASIQRVGYPSKSKSFATKAEAKAWAARIEAEITLDVAARSSPADHLTVARAIDRYMTEITPRRKTGQQLRSLAAKWKRSAIGPMMLGQVRAEHIISYRDTRISVGRGIQTIRNDVYFLRGLYRWARSEWSLHDLRNPCDGVRMASDIVPVAQRSRRRDRRCSDTELQRLIDACRDDEMTLIIMIAIESAMRLGEILRLTHEDIDLQRGVIRVTEPKNGHDRRVPISPTLGYMLDGFGCFETYVTSHKASAEFARVADRAGIDMVFHDLRHEATTRLVETGLFTMVEVAAITGHRTLAMLSRYSHPDPEMLAEKMRRMHGTRDG